MNDDPLIAQAIQAPPCRPPLLANGLALNLYTRSAEESFLRELSPPWERLPPPVTGTLSYMRWDVICRTRFCFHRYAREQEASQLSRAPADRSSGRLARTKFGSSGM